MMEGYHHPLYAQSFSEIGTPLFLKHSKGWLIKRQIPGTNHFDAMGPYPLFFCDNWEYLLEDILSFKKELIAVSFVIGPLEIFPINAFQGFFDVFYEYRTHYLLDTELPLEDVISSRRRRNTLKALNEVDLETIISPNIDLDEWCHLYENLIRKHKISGIRTFSRESFRKQLAIPDTHYFRVINHGDIVSGALFFLQNNSSYYHLAAQTEKGYGLQSGYAAMYTAIKALSKKVRWIEFQGGSSINDEVTDGLSEFKMGWASTQKNSYFCGKILDPQKYDEIHNTNCARTSNWFPSYRFGEYRQN